VVERATLDGDDGARFHANAAFTLTGGAVMNPPVDDPRRAAFPRPQPNDPIGLVLEK